MNASITEEQISEARYWIADAYPASPLDMDDEHPVYAETADRVQRFIAANYPGGWDAFAAECCTYTVVGR